MDISAAQQNPQITKFLQSNHTAVICTSNKQTSEPHGAVVYFSITSRLHLYFVTKTDTTKHRNLQTNPQVAAVVYDTAAQKTVQIKGTARILNDPQKLQTALELMVQYSRDSASISTLPISRLDAGQYVLYQIIPKVIRFGDFKYTPTEEIYQSVMPDDDSLV